MTTTAPPTVGGLQQVVETTVRQLDKDLAAYRTDFSVEEICLILPFECKGYFEDKLKGVSLHYFKMQNGIMGTLLTRTRVKRILREFRPDITHCHNVAHDSLITPRVKGSKKIVSSHGGDLAYVRGKSFGQRLTVKGALLVRVGLLDVDCIFAVSKAQARFAREVMNQEKVRVVPNPVSVEEPSFMSPSTSDNLPFPFYDSKKIVILSMSGSRELKDLETSIRAFSASRKQGVQAIYVHASTGPIIDAAKSLAEELEIGDDVFFVGEVSGLRRTDLLRRADLYLTSSHYEAFGLAALEAALFGTAVIATDVGGLGENFVHKNNAYLYPIGDYEEAAKGIAFAANNEQRTKLVSRGYELAGKFEPQKAVRFLLINYSQVLSDQSFVAEEPE